MCPVCLTNAALIAAGAISSGGLSGRARDQAAAWRQAVCSTQRPSGTITPLSSATGMNSAGLTGPSSGQVQRVSTSRPVMRPLVTSICGW